MNVSHLKIGSALLALAATPLLSACAPSVASLDCGEIVEEAKKVSQTQPLKIQSVEGARETSRADTDARCEGNATMSDGSTGTIYLRAYEENGNTMVAYQGTPFP